MRSLFELLKTHPYWEKPQRGDINKAKGSAPGFKPQRGDINKARGSAPGFKPQRGDINKAKGSAPGG